MGCEEWGRCMQMLCKRVVPFENFSNQFSRVQKVWHLHFTRRWQNIFFSFFTIASCRTIKTKLDSRQLEASVEIVRIGLFCNVCDITDPTVICCFADGESSERWITEKEATRGRGVSWNNVVICQTVAGVQKKSGNECERNSNLFAVVSDGSFNRNAVTVK